MSMVSSTGSGAKTEDVLAAILKRPDAMDTNLKALNSFQEKVTTLEEFADDMGTQAATLTTTIERVDMAHSKLTEKIPALRRRSAKWPATDHRPRTDAGRAVTRF
jgi:hypothetical protein